MARTNHATILCAVIAMASSPACGARTGLDSDRTEPLCHWRVGPRRVVVPDSVVGGLDSATCTANGCWLVLASGGTPPSANGTVQLQQLEFDGTPLGDVRTVGQTTDGWMSTIVDSPQQLLLVTHPSTGACSLQPLTNDGAPDGPPRWVGTGQCIGAWWAGNAITVIADVLQPSSSTTELWRVRTDGQILTRRPIDDPTPLFLTQLSRPHATGPNGSFVVGWGRSPDNDPFVQGFDVDAVPHGPANDLGAVGSVGPDLSLAQVGTGFVAVWTDVRPGASRYDLRMRDLTAQGSPASGEVSTLATGLDRAVPAVTGTMGVAWVAWIADLATDPERYALRGFTPSGQPLTDVVDVPSPGWPLGGLMVTTPRGAMLVIEERVEHTSDQVRIAVVPIFCDR